MKRILLSSVLLSVAVMSSSRADINLYVQPLDESLSGHYSNEGLIEVGNGFTLASDAAVSGVRWYGFYSGASYVPPLTTIDFSVAFFSDDSGLPGAEQWRQTLSAAITGTGLTVTNTLDHPGRTIYQFDAGFTPITMTGGAPMWLSIMENDADTPAVGVSQWLWNYSTYPGGMAVARYTDAWIWGDTPGGTAFTLTGQVVPLPGAVLLGVIGLACVGGLLRRSKAS